MTRQWRNAGLAWAVVLLVVAVQALTLHAAPDWYGDDYASYIHNARALRDGLPYPLPGYLPDLAVDAGPAAYPPGLPALLALTGTDFPTIGLVNVLCVGLAVRLFIALAGGGIHAAAAGLLVGLSPFFSAFKGVVASEFLFLVLILAWLLLERRRGMAGLVLGAALLTRLAGLPALAAGPVADLLGGRLSWRSLTTPLIAALLLVAGLFVLTPELFAHYVANVRANAEGGGAGLGSLPGRLSVLWSYAGQGAQPPMSAALDLLRKAATVVLLLAAFGGLAWRVRVGARSAEAYFLVSLGVLAALPEIMAGPRLFLPLSVLVVVYALDLAGRLPRPALARWGVIALLVCGEAPTFVAMANAPGNPYTATEPRAVEFLDWLRGQPRTVVLARRARAIAFFTGQGASDWHQGHADALFLDWAKARGATLIAFSIDQADSRRLAADASPASLNAALDRYEADFFGPDRARYAPVFSNERFRVYRLP